MQSITGSSTMKSSHREADEDRTNAARKRVEDAMAQIEHADAYVEAMRRAPHLVHAESNPLTFLCHANFDAKAAAEWLALYWKRRQELFRDKAMLPMTLLNGQGALGKDEINFIRTAVVAFLPRDAEGRTVVCIDHSRKIEDSRDILLRALFFCSQVIAENTVSQAKGFSVIVLLRGLKHDSTTPEMISTLQTGFPISVANLHLFPCPREGHSKGHQVENMTDLTGSFTRILPKCRIHIHPTSEKKQNDDIFKQQNMKKEDMPIEIGGFWSYDFFDDWVADRQHGGQQHQHQEEEVADSKPAAVQVTDSTSEENMDDNNSETQQQSPFGNWHRHQIEKAILKLDPPDKAACTEALKSAPPKVWEEESRIDWFLEAENFHPLFATERLGLYWRLRSGLFGPKKYLSLYQTGEHALGLRELTVLNSEFAMLLPDDSSGCPVLWVDVSQLPPSSKAASRDRTLFYMLSLVAENELSRTHGAVLIYRMEAGRRHNIKFVKTLVDCFPLRLKAMHILSDHQVSDGIVSSLKVADQTFVHVDASMNGMAPKLKTFGFKEAGLPKAIGGGWGQNTFHHWMELRARLEWKIPLGYSKRDYSTGAYELPGIRPYETLPEKEKEERLRRMNVIHCRRKRDRRRMQRDDLEEQCEELRATKERLVAENKRLTDLVNSALEVAVSVSRGQNSAFHSQLPSAGAYARTMESLTPNATSHAYQRTDIQALQAGLVPGSHSAEEEKVGGDSTNAGLLSHTTMSTNHVLAVQAAIANRSLHDPNNVLIGALLRQSSQAHCLRAGAAPAQLSLPTRGVTATDLLLSGLLQTRQSQIARAQSSQIPSVAAAASIVDTSAIARQREDLLARQRARDEQLGRLYGELLLQGNLQASIGTLPSRHSGGVNLQSSLLLGQPLAGTGSVLAQQQQQQQQQQLLNRRNLLLRQQQQQQQQQQFGSLMLNTPTLGLLNAPIAASLQHTHIPNLSMLLDADTAATRNLPPR